MGGSLLLRTPLYPMLISSKVMPFLKTIQQQLFDSLMRFPYVECHIFIYLGRTCRHGFPGWEMHRWSLSSGRRQGSLYTA